MLLIVQWLHGTHNGRCGPATGKQGGAQGDGGGVCGSGTNWWECHTVRRLPSVRKILMVEVAPSAAPTYSCRLSFSGMKPTPFFLGRICASFSESRTLWAL